MVGVGLDAAVETVVKRVDASIVSVVIESSMVRSVWSGLVAVDVSVSSPSHPLETFPQQRLAIFETVSSKSNKYVGGGTVGIALYTGLVGVVQSIDPSPVPFWPPTAVVVFGFAVVSLVAVDDMAVCV